MHAFKAVWKRTHGKFEICGRACLSWQSEHIFLFYADSTARAAHVDQLSLQLLLRAFAGRDGGGKVGHADRQQQPC